MLIFKPQKPRRFNYLPQYYKPEEDKQKIHFRRLSQLDPRSRSRMPIAYIIFFLIVGAVLYYLGGIPKTAAPPQLTLEDVSGTRTMSKIND